MPTREIKRQGQVTLRTAHALTCLDHYESYILVNLEQWSARTNFIFNEHPGHSLVLLGFLRRHLLVQDNDSMYVFHQNQGEPIIYLYNVKTGEKVLDRLAEAQGKANLIIDIRDLIKEDQPETPNGVNKPARSIVLDDAQVTAPAIVARPVRRGVGALRGTEEVVFEFEDPVPQPRRPVITQDTLERAVEAQRRATAGRTQWPAPFTGMSNEDDWGPEPQSEAIPLADDGRPIQLEGQPGQPANGAVPVAQNRSLSGVFADPESNTARHIRRELARQARRHGRSD
jgi:hypothetical protein